VATCHSATSEGNERKQGSVHAPAHGTSGVQGCDQKNAAQGNYGHALQDAERARLKPKTVLRVQRVGH
jgi:hypothetical protein